jgi:hypothetical protein
MRRRERPLDLPHQRRARIIATDDLGTGLLSESRIDVVERIFHRRGGKYGGSRRGRDRRDQAVDQRFFIERLAQKTDRSVVERMGSVAVIRMTGV